MRQAPLPAWRRRAIEEALTRALEREAAKQSRRLSLLAVIVCVAPLIGLLGTVWGILDSLNTIHYHRGHCDCLPGGFHRALVTTAMALMVAIPARALLHILQNRSQRALLQVEAEAKRLLAPVLDQREARGQAADHAQGRPQSRP